jgi:hypothetical protein
VETEDGKKLLWSILGYRDLPIPLVALIIMPVNFAVLYLVSLFAAAPKNAVQTMHELHDPDGPILINTNR